MKKTPDVLVLSRFAGTAEQLKQVLLVNPYDTHGTAEAVQQALQIPLAERQAAACGLAGDSARV